MEGSGYMIDRIPIIAACATDALLYYLVTVSLAHILNSRKEYSQYIIIQTDKARLAEDEVKVLQRLRHPKALTLIKLLGLLPFRYCDIGDGGMRILG